MVIKKHPEITYLTFREVKASPGRKTKIWVVRGTGDIKLGEVRWYAPWRQYCFYPEDATIWSTDCMIDLCEFIAKAELERKKSREAVPASTAG